MQYSIYRLADGLFTGRRVVVSDQKQLAANIPDGCAAIRGTYLPGRHRVDLQSGGVVEVEYTDSPQPSEAKQRLRDRIAHHEANSQRALREAMIDPHDVQARDRLAAVNNAIAALRKQLQDLG